MSTTGPKSKERVSFADFKTAMALLGVADLDLVIETHFRAGQGIDVLRAIPNGKGTPYVDYSPAGGWVLTQDHISVGERGDETDNSSSLKEQTHE